MATLGVGAVRSEVGACKGSGGLEGIVGPGGVRGVLQGPWSLVGAPPTSCTGSPITSVSLFSNLLCPNVVVVASAAGLASLDWPLMNPCALRLFSQVSLGQAVQETRTGHLES